MRTNKKQEPRQRALPKMMATLVLATALFGLNSCQKKADTWGVNTTFEIHSANTERDYAIEVFYPDATFPSDPVPVLLVLDGFWYHEMAAELVRELSDEGTIPKCLVVSIDYAGGGGVYTRAEDLVYPHPNTDETRKGDLFYQFLTEELMPQIESDYATDTTQRTLFGHSLGGYFALYSLMDNSDDPFFKKRIAASCSIGMDDNELFVQEALVSETRSDIEQSLFIGCGTLVGSAPIMHQEYFNRLRSRNYPSLDVEFETYQKTHGTDVYPSLKNGLRHVFN